ncbi:HNH endonuclease [Puniceibacterium sediminis]|uniref:HNH endonuclease n=1 Tax=Puniceibacterium sediminis TaxID=1608407 RepID=A0A238ZFP6_9RHOB|nr:HNH endonuclease signature motif containing protein [Puniceibacterium sediminis]SNR81942.1 HNH endonuclease [Puniceibacterium sediminis]
MTELTFDRDQAEEAIDRVKAEGQAWLYENYPKPNGQMRKSSTGFLMYEGVAYPVKPLGRLANELAGNPMTNNPITNVFRRYFEGLGFQLIENVNNEAEIAAARQRRLADVWERPGQAKFRRMVFETFGARCLISGCETLAVLEAAHIIPVSCGGGDEAWNGIPLRADLHRLFDAGIIVIDAQDWTISIEDAALKDYSAYDGIDLSAYISKTEGNSKFAMALKKRMSLISENK